MAAFNIVSFTSPKLTVNRSFIKLMVSIESRTYGIYIREHKLLVMKLSSFHLAPLQSSLLTLD